MTAIFIPLKVLSLAKSRLAGKFHVRMRKRLVLAMLADLLCTVRRGVHNGTVFVASEDRTLARWLRVYHPDIRFLPWPGSLNEVCDRAAQELWRAGYTRLVVLHGDLPCATAGEIRTLAAPETDIALVADRHGIGTNALASQLPSGFSAMFGADSLRRHIAQCEQKGLRFRVFSGGGLSQDLDTPRDLTALRLPPQGRTAGLLARAAQTRDARRAG